ncbi:hypothetical protein ACODT5_16215 [Streptomyces sp. 5.8]|uniref:hypothetical protein n=1 Tax=Streptomyces sp. 5.8 TaxID=3406571 RepID=UPI003BB4A902
MMGILGKRPLSLFASLRFVEESPPLVVVGVCEADLDQARLGFVIDPSDRFTT